MEGMAPSVAWLAPRILLIFGIGFLVANLQAGLMLAAYRRRRRATLLVWEQPRPRLYGFSLALGLVLALLIAIEVLYGPAPQTVFGEAMMFVYYAYAFPLSARIKRGFYDEGVWSDTGFLRWAEIGGVAWREGASSVTLVLLSRGRGIARRLEVPANLYGQVRRLLRDRVKAHGIDIGGAGLELGARDARDSV
jgi:hypothetical protein